ncbi:MAG: PDZ domain-containing protein [Myxacorys californica WJT36-NPBG1]|jgi:carboxyl-terminal processing protease|nr:PDZ domain-containing protein [Myxacorys californica WJT36-NPBG1]
MRKRSSWFRSLIIGVLSVAIAFGVVSPAHALTENQKLLNEAWRVIDRAYVDSTFNHSNWWGIREKYLKQPLPDREATYAAIAQMVAVLDDPFTRLLKPDQYRSLQTTTSGELTGVGLQIALDLETKLLKVISPIEGSPAAKSGIQAADIILKIDGVSTQGLSLDEAAERMRGKIGSQVTLTVARTGQAEQDLVLRRDRIAVNPVMAELRPQTNGKKVGYLKLSQFNANATMEVAHAIAKLESQGADSYILDLRNNPGGLLNAGVEIARLWLNDGTIVYTVNRQGTIGSFEALGGALTDDPLVVLVNQGTASASEILAGALHDNKRAAIVGEKTFGKGLIQSLFDLSDGAGLAVTVAKYETPNHTDINKLGIQPDRIVALDQAISLDQIGTAADNQYQAAVETVTSDSLVAGNT